MQPQNPQAPQPAPSQNQPLPPTQVSAGRESWLKAPIAEMPGSVTPISAVPPQFPDGYDPALKHIIPVGRSGLAIAAGYLGLFSMLILPAPLALTIGILALFHIKKHPKKLGKGRAWFGVIAGALGTLVILWGLFSILTAQN